MCIKHMPKKCNTAKQIWYDLWVFKKILLCISDAFILRNDGAPCYHILSFNPNPIQEVGQKWNFKSASGNTAQRWPNQYRNYFTSISSGHTDNPETPRRFGFIFLDVSVSFVQVRVCLNGEYGI